MMANWHPEIPADVLDFLRRAGAEESFRIA
jgi:hypothetical protein